MKRNTFTRRIFLRGMGTAFGLSLLSPLDSLSALTGRGSCPQLTGKKMRWIVPHAPGGGYDTYSRLIEPFYEKELGAEIVVENIRGAGGLVGATALKDAEPDGKTIGILNGPGLMVIALAGDKRAPNPATDFTILGRVARSQHILATGSKSPFKTIEDVIKESRKRPIVFGTRDAGSSSFVSLTISSHLLGMDHEVVPGYSGSGAGVLAAVRGEVDLVSYNFSSVLNQIENGDIRPLLQVSQKQISSHASLKKTPLLAGDTGLAVQRAKELGRDINEARENANAVVALIGAGRLIVAPLAMEQSLSECLKKSLYRTLNSIEFKKAATKANRLMDIERADRAYKDIQVVQANMDKFIVLIQEALQKIRK